MARGFLILLCLLSTFHAGCRQKQKAQEARVQKSENWKDTASKLPQKVPDGDPESPDEPRKSQADESTESGDSVSDEDDAPYVVSRILWTGSQYAVVWFDAGTGDPWNVVDVDDFEVRMMMIGDDESEPVVLEGAGEGPKKLSGPLIGDIVWHRDTLVLTWIMWNEEVDPPYPARFVIGMWRADGTPVVHPRIVNKEKLHSTMLAYNIGPSSDLVSTGSALYLVLPSERGPNVTGCKSDYHDGTDSLELFEIGSAGEVVETRYVCGNVMHGYRVKRFGDGLMAVIHNRHVSDHYDVIFNALGKHDITRHTEHENPLVDSIFTGGGAALWWDEMQEDDYEKAKGHCVRIEIADGMEGGPEAKCARPRSKKLVWNDDGLFLQITAKNGTIHSVPYLPGTKVDWDLLKKALVKKVPLASAVYGGESIGLAWSKGAKVEYRVITREDFKQ